MDTRYGSCANWTIRNNLWLHAEGTGGITFDSVGFSASDYVRIYGNVFYSGYYESWDIGNGVIAGWTGGNGEQFKNISMMNNTFIGIRLPMTNLPINFSGNSAINNLFYNCTAMDFSKFTNHHHNHFINSGSADTNGSTSTGDPFVDYINLNFQLKTNTPAGDSTIGSPYNLDPLGSARTTWTRGAYEFGGGGGGGGGNPIPHPADTNTDFFLSLTEATSFGACWKSNCSVSATLDNAVRAAMLWNATSDGRYQYNSSASGALRWEVKP